MPVTVKLRATAAILLLLADVAQAASNVPAGAPEGTAVAKGSVQRISVGTSQGLWDPSVIHAVPGIPLEITFAEGRGCLASVLFPDFGIDQDLTAGGEVVKLPAMKAGSYEFSCGMEMVYGKIVVR
jgi:plastocyanin domain-containing protein